MSTPEMQIDKPEASDPASALYRLDYETNEAELRAGKKRLLHIFRRPSFDDLHARSQKVINEEINQSATETEPIYDDTAANCFLYDRLIARVKGYRTGAEDVGGWSDVTPETCERIPDEHKRQAISAIYQAQAKVLEDDDDGLFPLVGAIETKIELEIAGQYKTIHYFQQPTEAQWQQLKRKQVQTRQLRGAKKQTFRYAVQLAPARDFYDGCLIRLEGVSLGENEAPFDSSRRAEFVNAVDAIHKMLIVAAFAEYWGARLRD